MGECGCYTNGPRYKLPGPRGLVYVFKLLPSCECCYVGQTIIVEEVRKKDIDRYEWSDILDMDTLPVSHEIDGRVRHEIGCGPSKSELIRIAEYCAFGGVDECAAGVLAEEMFSLMPPLKVVELVPEGVRG